MADPREVIHQIEYRWQHEKDLSPFATTMSQSMTAWWNDSIRSWVRHPHAPGLPESVCYQVWDHTGDAVLAWRYRDPRAAERVDGTSGRPHVSRVLIGHASLLSPEVAIALCLLGLPPSARPHRVSAPDELPTISPGELITRVDELAAGLDRAAAQGAALPELVAAALSDRDRPLAVYLPEDLIVGRLRDSPQGLLLWGLHRIMGVVPGAGRRGWSFSTFELPLGAQDAATLPDIVFRQAKHASAPPGIVRDEVKAWLFDADALAELPPQDVGRARRLVGAYAADGIDGVERIVTDDVSHQLRDQPTVLLRTAGNPDEGDSSGDVDTAFIRSGPPSPFIPTGSPQRTDAPPETAQAEPVVHEPIASHELASPQPAAQPQPWEQRSGRGYRDGDLLVSDREGQSAPPLPQPWQPLATDSVPPAENRAAQGSYWQPGRLDYMLKQMREAANPSALHEILQFIVVSRADVGRNDREEGRVERQEARRIMSRDDWYDSVTRSSGCRLGARELAGIFQIIVIPDLGKSPDVAERIGGWARGADPEMICGLLIAARDAGLKERTGLIMRRSKKDPVQQVRQIMLPRLASRWTEEKGIAQWWDIDQLP